MRARACATRSPRTRRSVHLGLGARVPTGQPKPVVADVPSLRLASACFRLRLRCLRFRFASAPVPASFSFSISQSQQLLAALDAHGALLLRGWAVSSAEEFAAAMRALPLTVCTDSFPAEPHHTYHLLLATRCARTTSLRNRAAGHSGA